MMASFHTVGKIPDLHYWLKSSRSGFSCSRPKVLYHLIIDTIFAWGLLCLESSDCIIELCSGTICSHGGGRRHLSVLAVVF